MIMVLRLGLVAAVGLVCAGHAEAADLTPPAEHPQTQQHYSVVGLASWYGSEFAGHATADGETFDMRALSAAHRSLPLPCYARVTNLGNGRSVIVRVNDRGPYVGGRILDVSARVAELLEFKGITKVRVDYVGKAAPAGSDGPMLLASLQTGSARAAAAPRSPPAGFDLAALLASLHSVGAPAVAEPASVGVSPAAQPSPDEGVTVAARVVERRTTPDKGVTTAARTIERRKATDIGVVVAARVVEPAPSTARAAADEVKTVLAGFVEPPSATGHVSPFGDLTTSPFLAQAALP
jgi:rare lipoprotein A (peptidoglycan hydrolase)